MTALPDLSRDRLRPSFKADGILAMAILLIVAILVVPLPALALDLLVAANLALSIVALIGTLYVSNAARISTFPSVLLVAALGRVSLSVAATRLILVHADAGSVIRSFGQSVVHGNYVVGAVIFLIITIVEFVVVAKGSERVAEVAARLRSTPCQGSKWPSMPRRVPATRPGRRQAAPQRERDSHFFSAADGATKFVKGDVVASAKSLPRSTSPAVSPSACCSTAWTGSLRSGSTRCSRSEPAWSFKSRRCFSQRRLEYWSRASPRKRARHSAPTSIPSSSETSAPWGFQRGFSSGWPSFRDCPPWRSAISGGPGAPANAAPS
jgi:hypothetical protein